MQREASGLFWRRKWGFLPSFPGEGNHPAYALWHCWCDGSRYQPTIFGLLQNYIARFGHGSAKLARQAQSKEKTLQKMMASGLTERVISDKVGHWESELVLPSHPGRRRAAPPLAWGFLRRWESRGPGLALATLLVGTVGEVVASLDPGAFLGRAGSWV